jgi:hypothetical protein
MKTHFRSEAHDFGTARDEISHHPAESRNTWVAGGGKWHRRADVTSWNAPCRAVSGSRRWSNSYSTWQGVPEYRTALDLLAGGRLDAGPIVTHRFPRARVAAAFAAADDKRASGAIKVIVTP